MTYSCIQPASQQVFLNDYFCAQHSMFKPSPEGYAEINPVRGWDRRRILRLWATSKHSAEARETPCEDREEGPSAEGTVHQLRRPGGDAGVGGGARESWSVTWTSSSGWRRGEPLKGAKQEATGTCCGSRHTTADVCNVVQSQWDWKEGGPLETGGPNSGRADGEK